MVSRRLVQGLAAIVASTLWAAPAARAQPTIAIQSVPPYSTSGWLTGNVSGVDFATHRVAVYIQIEGAGWWSKPSLASPTVPIRSDGSFLADVVGGGLDDRATIFFVALVGPGVTVPTAAGSSRVPSSLTSLATDELERYARTITFAGREWAVKEAPLPAGPGSNLFSGDPRDVFVDAQGRLHLVVRYRNGQWRCAEVMSVEKLGFGTYWFTTESELEDLDPYLTFGAFTWDPYGDETTVPRSLHREIDFEDSRWGSTTDPTTSQVVVQPWDIPGNLIRFTLPDLAAAPTLTRILTWTPTRIEFTAARGRHSPCSLPPASVLHRSAYTHAPFAGRHVPTEGRPRFHFNLWINRNGAPQNGQTAEVVISDFRFARVAGTFVGGCGVNPSRSITALSGSTSAGSQLIVGLDNPAGTQSAGSLAALVLGAAADVSFPCGTELPGWGMSGPTGELQLDVGSGMATVDPVVYWNGPGMPALVQVSIPATPSLVGRSAYAQGVLVDLAPNAVQPLGVTDALEICIRP
jgi:hypothetical protein